MTDREILIDSSVLYAFINASDAEHQRVRDFLPQNKTPLVVTNFILAESISLVTKRLGKSFGRTLGSKILNSSFVRLVYLSKSLQQEAWDLYDRYQDKDFDLIDATSFAFCKANKIQKVLTFDHHFTQMGFQCLP